MFGFFATKAGGTATGDLRGGQASDFEVLKQLTLSVVGVEPADAVAMFTVAKLHSNVEKSIGF